MKMSSKLTIFLLTILTLLVPVYSVDVYNENGDFSVAVEEQRTQVFNDDIDTTFTFAVTNNQPFDQNIKLLIPDKAGWDIETQFESFSLQSEASREVNIRFTANSEFDYSPNVVSPDVIKITQKDQYVGFFEFPLAIEGEDENISLVYEVSIDRREALPVEFTTKIAPGKLSPVSPLKYTINAENLDGPQSVAIKVELGDRDLSNFEDEFSNVLNYKIFSQEIPVDVDPGTYDAHITTRISTDGNSAQEWFQRVPVEVVAYEKIREDKSSSENVFKDSYTIKITNEGNIDDTYETTVETGFFGRFLFGASLDGEQIDYESSGGSAEFAIPLERGESKELVYSFNYLALYIILIVLVLLAIYILVRKTSNPLDVETAVYEVKRVQHEGVKSLKVRIGFENIKEPEIDDLRITFRMPNYLQVKEGSFTLTEPKHVMKGRNQFKLLWDFKRFERDDSRIIGFTLVNKKGVLGDIKVPDLEVDVKVNGKVRKYFHSFPIIKG